MYFTNNTLKFTEEYVPNKDLELELKFKLQNSQIKHILDTLNQSEMAPPQSIYSVTLFDDFKRRESFYDTKTLKKTSHIDVCKTPLYSAESINKTTPKIRCVLAKEETINAFDTKKVKLIRIKKRYRFVNAEGYYIDITEIKTVSNMTPKLPEVIQTFFKSECCDCDFELEIEFTKRLDFFKVINSLCVYILGLIGLHKVINTVIIDISSYLYKSGVLKRQYETLKQITNNPKLFSRKVFEKDFEPGKYLALEKTDGQRCLLKIWDLCFTEILEGEIKVFGKECEAGSEKYSLIDCEKQDDEYYAFDIIIHNGVYLQDNYNKRLELLREIAENTKIYKIKDIKPITCENLNALMYGSKREVDGLIFQEIHNDYYNAKIYKWKPAEMITIDFLIVPMPYKGVKPFISNKNIYLLMTGCSKSKLHLLGVPLPKVYNKLMFDNNINIENYNPIPFMPALNRDTYIWESHDNHVLSAGEFSYNVNTKKWKLVKIRHDKTLLIKNRVYGNDYFVAEDTFNELQNPLKLAEICEIKGGLVNQYFIKNKSTEYVGMAKFNNYVKYSVMRSLRNVNKVLDIASGRGSDIFIYNGLEVKNVTFVEPDLNAFIELTDRLRKLNDPKFYVHTPKPYKNMSYNLVNEDYDTFAHKSPSKYDALVCNFAAHYFLKDENDYKYFNNFCKANGITLVILTIYDTEIVEKHMVNDVYENDKYYIKNLGDKYFVKHHFATELIPENKINTNRLIKCMRNYKVVARDSFKHFLELYQQKKNVVLQPIDAEYSSFYQYIVFRLN